MNRDSENIEGLIQRYLDGAISAQEMRQLNGALMADRDHRRTFSEMLNFDSALAAAAAGWVPERREREPWHRRISLPHAALGLGAAACLVAAVLSIQWWGEVPGGFASVQGGAGVIELADGAEVGGERVEIGAGVLELLTRRGARIVIEAPAEFQFESAQVLRLIRGRLAADVSPSAKGFTVVTPTGEAVDLGTRFGVDVPASGTTEIHVFDGEVVARPSGSGADRSLRGGEALTLAQGAGTERELRPAAFIQADEMAALTAGLAGGQRARSEAAVEALMGDPALVAFLDFEPAATGEIPGAFRVVQGRWPGSRALEFVRDGDHMKLDVGGARAWPQLTLAAWVRLDRLGAPYHSLLHTDGWSQSNPGQVHWMINRNSTMRLALFGNTLAPGSDESEGFPDSRRPVLPEVGRWVHLATVYDASAGTVRFFLDGGFDKETRQETAHPARLGPAQIGNWNRDERKLSGRVDELLILGRAMTDAEVRALFAAGNPYRSAPK